MKTKLLLITLCVASLGLAKSTPRSGATPDDVVPKFMVAQAGTRVQISWETKVGEKYAIFYSDHKKIWVKLPAGKFIYGTGKQATVNDTFKKGRRYQVKILNPKKK